MKVALVNPRWSFEHSIYFGCRQPHLPLELGYAKAMLERERHVVLMLDGHLFDRDDADLAEATAPRRPHRGQMPLATGFLSRILRLTGIFRLAVPLN